MGSNFIRPNISNENEWFYHKITKKKKKIGAGEGLCSRWEKPSARSCEIQSEPNPELFDTVLVWMRSENFMRDVFSS